MKSIRKGDVWRVLAGDIERHVLVISSDMFNEDSGLGHVLAMLVTHRPGPYSFAARMKLDVTVAEFEWHVWPAHLYSVPHSTLVEDVATVDVETISEAHTRLFMMLYESSAPPKD